MAPGNGGGTMTISSAGGEGGSMTVQLICNAATNMPMIAQAVKIDFFMCAFPFIALLFKNSILRDQPGALSFLACLRRPT
jgi:hypothetical protein